MHVAARLHRTSRASARAPTCGQSTDASLKNATTFTSRSEHASCDARCNVCLLTLRVLRGVQNAVWLVFVASMTVGYGLALTLLSPSSPSIHSLSSCCASVPRQSSALSRFLAKTGANTHTRPCSTCSILSRSCSLHNLRGTHGPIHVRHIVFCLSLSLRRSPLRRCGPDDALRSRGHLSGLCPRHCDGSLPPFRSAVQRSF